jgi:hypothetical protein
MTTEYGPLVEVTQEAPVSWLDPVGLIRTGIKTVQAAMFGTFADKREVIAALHPEDVKVEKPALDHSDCDEIYFDYIADTGDGWNATYSIACLAGEKVLRVAPAGSSAAAPLELPASHFTVLGGDEVYPTASADTYRNRFEDPFYCARTTPAERTPIYAMPGNHDWYDGLSFFMRLFCQKDRNIGQWVATQTRSYFAIQLPHRWWIWGIDVQLESDLDPSQVEYFRYYAKKFLKAGDRVIMCAPEPTWIDAGAAPRQGRRDTSKAHRNTLHLEECIAAAKAEIRLRIAGDLHHYARYQGTDGAQLVTCGGGGAFLHPTHGLPPKLYLKQDKSFNQDFVLQPSVYPSAEKSKLLRWGVFKLLQKNPGFAVVVGFIYSLYAWLLEAASEALTEHPSPNMSLIDYFQAPPSGTVVGQVAWGWWSVVTHAPGALFLSLAIVGGAYAYGLAGARKSESKLTSKYLPGLGGLLHGLAHLAAAVLLMWGAAMFAEWAKQKYPDWSAWVFVWTAEPMVYALITLVGALVGGLLMALYMLLANLLYGGHDQEVLSCQGIEDYKCFTRIHIRKDGSAALYPIKLEKVAREWKPAQGAKVISDEHSGLYARTVRLTVPANTRRIFEPATPLAPQLIEPPVPL